MQGKATDVGHGSMVDVLIARQLLCKAMYLVGMNPLVLALDKIVPDLLECNNVWGVALDVSLQEVEACRPVPIKVPDVVGQHADGGRSSWARTELSVC